MVDREKLITELANEIAHFCPDKVEDGCGACNCVSCLATKLYKAGYRKTEQQWIPVTERLPNICEPVLVCFDFMGGKAIRVSDRYGKNGMLWAGLSFNEKVTHWMHLPPDPPKGE